MTYRAALDGGAEVVASGGAEIGNYQSSEVVHVKDVTEIGPLPDALAAQARLWRRGSTANVSPQPALSFIKFLAEPENRNASGKSGFDPLPSSARALLLRHHSRHDF